MALNYDFDMLSTAPEQETGAAAAPTGPVALFREPATVAALERAPQAVQDYLRACHFGINCYHSGAPAGRYPQVDDAARITVIEALAENIRRFDLPRADDSQPDPQAFHLPSFFAAVAEAEPIAMEPALAAPSPEPKAETAEIPMPMPTLILSGAMATAATDTLIADMVAVGDTDRDGMTDEIVADETPAFEIAADAAPAASPETAQTDGLIAALVDADSADATQPADSAELAPPPPRRFRVAVPLRWVTAGAAVAVLGVAFGSALI